MSHFRLLPSLLALFLLLGPARAEKQPHLEIPLAELYVQTSAEYRALSHQTYNLAWMQFQNWAPLMEKREDGKAYLTGSDKPVAIILDLDETVIDNSGFQAFGVITGVQYRPELWTAWIEFQGINKAAGRTVPGAPEFLARMKEIGVTPIFISNRTVGHEPPTIKVLERAGIDVNDIENRLFLRYHKAEEVERGREVARSQGLRPGSLEERAVLEGEGLKEARRRLMQEKYDVVAYFGDVLGDFEPYLALAEDSRREFEQRQDLADQHKDMWGSTWFVLPNPMYGSWSAGHAIPRDEMVSSLSDFGFSTYLRGRRMIK